MEFPAGNWGTSEGFFCSPEGSQPHAPPRPSRVPLCCVRGDKNRETRLSVAFRSEQAPKSAPTSGFVSTRAYHDKGLLQDPRDRRLNILKQACELPRLASAMLPCRASGSVHGASGLWQLKTGHAAHTVQLGSLNASITMAGQAKLLYQYH